MRQPKWDKYETALLIEAYWRIKENSSKRRSVISELSSALRGKAGSEIDETFRNENGVNMRLGELDYLFSGGKIGLKNTSDLFREMVNTYLNNKSQYEQILLEAKKKYSITKNVEKLFCEWIKRNYSQYSPDVICQLLARGEEFCLRINVLPMPLFETTDIEVIKKYVRTVTNNKIFRVRNKKQHTEIINAANLYYLFVRALPELESDGSEEEMPPKTTATHIVDYSETSQETDDYTLSQTANDRLESYFYRWLIEEEELAEPTCRSYVSALHSAEAFAEENRINPSLICTMDYKVALATVSSLLQNPQFREYNKTQHNRFSAAFRKLEKFFSNISTDTVVIEPSKNTQVLVEKNNLEPSVPDELMKSVDEILKSASNGITKDEMCNRVSGFSVHQINAALAACHAVLVLKKYYHPDNISDYYEMADILLDVIKRQFSQNGDYTSAQQLYNEARSRLDDFFFYNNAFDSRQEVYDLAVHLFGKERYKGNSFVFVNNMHIWKTNPDYPKDFHGLMIKYAREHGNIFSREEAIKYFEQIGSPSPSQTFSNILFTTGKNSFLQYAENQFVLSETIHINEYFLSSVTAQIERLLEGEDYVAMGEIDDYFYTTLPSLPSGVYWSALLLEDILRVHDTDFWTIKAGKDNDKKTVPAAIVRKKSHYRTFSDLVWNEVSKSFSLPKEFTASQFREFLLDKGFIHGSEKMWSVHKTVAGDIRFYWTDNNGKVTIN